MKSSYEFDNSEMEKQFKKLSDNEIRAMTLGFLRDYEMPRTKFANRCNLSPGSLGRWLDNNETYKEGSLRRIFAFLAEYYPRWRDFVDEVKE